MKKQRIPLVAAAALLVLSGAVALSQERGQRDDQNRQASTEASRNWYKQHQDHPSRGFRKQDQLSADEEARLREGERLDRSFQKRTYSVPRDLSRNLPKAPRGHRYVVIGGHVVMMDNNRRVTTVIHLHDDR
jgi:Ni/Co efflux regulator RcnB